VTPLDGKVVGVQTSGTRLAWRPYWRSGLLAGLQLYYNHYCNQGGPAWYAMVLGEHPGYSNANNGILSDTQ